ncbi:MAG: response regulator [Okeania sp. SIO2C9]|nr:response regulator [Okeania sp. SIO2C9]
MDGERALKRLQHYQPDLILLDIQMSGIDCFETYRRLKADRNTSHIPVIFLIVFVQRTRMLSI